MTRRIAVYFRRRGVRNRLKFLITMFYLLSAAFPQVVLPTTLHKYSQKILTTDAYISEVISKIKKNLDVDRIKATCCETLIAEVDFKVSSNGIVTDFNFKKQSANEYFNTAIFDAFMASLPFEPFPPNIEEVASLKVDLKFTLKCIPCAALSFGICIFFS